MWLPVPQTDAYQRITALRVEAPISHTFEREGEYGNMVLCLEGDAPVPRELQIVMEADVERLPRVAESTRRDPNAAPRFPRAGAPEQRFLTADRLVPIDGKIARIALDVTRGRTTNLEKARAIYDHVTTSMKYDKSGEGWGRGDALHACDVLAGNCTDFHALFIGMCRAVGVPAIFEIGFPLPEDKTEGVIAGYHCWAEFFAPGTGWVPVDCSEASKNTDRLDFYFGSLDPNRVLFTYGRDIQIEGAAEQSPLNYFIYPVVAIDGKPHASVTREVRFVDRPS